MKPWSLVTPSSRGLGLALTRHVLRASKIPVVATARSDLPRARDDILKGLDADANERLTVLRVDMFDEESIARAASECKSRFSTEANYLHLAFVLPGILHPERAPSQLSEPSVLETFRTNVVGPLMMMKHFAPFLPRKSTSLPSSTELQNLSSSHATYAHVSARVGSITDNRLGGWYSYRASKAALNQVSKTFDNHLRTQSGDKAISIALHPGTVKTDLSKAFWENVREDKLFKPSFAAERLYDVVKTQSTGARGKIWDWQGHEVPP